jgi:hypothetical protein
MPVPHFTTVSIHSDGVFDGGGFANVIDNDSDHVVDIVSIDIDNVTDVDYSSQSCNTNIAHVRVSDFAYDSQCDSVFIEPVSHVDVCYNKVHAWCILCHCN